MIDCYSLKNNTADYFISFIAALVIIKTPLYNCFSYTSIPVDRAFYVVYGVNFVISSFLVFARNKSFNAKAFIISLYISLFVLLNCYRSYLDRFVGDSVAPLFFFMLLPFIMMSFVRKVEILYLVLNHTIFLYYVLGVLTILQFNNVGYGYGSWAMMATYSLAVPTSFYIYKAMMSQRKVVYAILALLGVIMSLIPGSRGCLILYAFSFILGMMRIRNQKPVILFGAIVLLVLVSCGEFLLDIFEDSRFLFKIQEGSLLSDSGRTSTTWLPAWNAALKNPLFGWGSFGDRMFTYNNQWAHNLFIEVFCDYGLIVGGVFMFWFIARSYRCLKYDKNEVVVLLFLISVPQLLVSSSFLLSTNFWIYMGVLLSYKNNPSRTHQTPSYNTLIT